MSAPAIDSPSNRTSPSIRAPLMRSFIRLKQRKSVLLPQPDGPINAVILLRGMSIVISLIARLDPYQTERHRVDSTTGSLVRVGPVEDAAPIPLDHSRAVRGVFRRRSSMVS